MIGCFMAAESTLVFMASAPKSILLCFLQMKLIMFLRDQKGKEIQIHPLPNIRLKHFQYLKYLYSRFESIP